MKETSTSECSRSSATENGPGPVKLYRHAHEWSARPRIGQSQCRRPGSVLPKHRPEGILLGDGRSPSGYWTSCRPQSCCLCWKLWALLFRRGGRLVPAVQTNVASSLPHHNTTKSIAPPRFFPRSTLYNYKIKHLWAQGWLVRIVRYSHMKRQSSAGTNRLRGVA